MADHHRDEVVRLVTASSPQEAHLWRQALEGRGTAGKAVRVRRTVVIRNGELVGSGPGR
jgi:hypothetical protein